MIFNERSASCASMTVGELWVESMIFNEHGASCGSSGVPATLYAVS